MYDPMTFGSKRTPFIIDCEIHQHVCDFMQVKERMPKIYRHRIGGLPGRAEYPTPYGGARKDASSTSPEEVCKHLMDPFDIDLALLNGSYTSVSVLPDQQYASAMASAYNDCLIDYWLDSDPRFRGSVLIATQDPKAAAAEIRRAGQHPKMIQVTMTSSTQMPFGQSFYDPIHEAAAEMGLPIAIHPGREGTGMSGQPTANGWPSSYLEWHTILSTSYMTQMASVLCEGVFVKHPNLRLLLLEGGFSWLPHLLWRLDKAWKALRASVPIVKDLPSTYIDGHVWLGTQPVEEPTNPKDLLDVFRMINADKTLCFATDYPHWDFDSPAHAMPRFIPQETLDRIMYKNAVDLYNLHDELKTWEKKNEEAHCLS